MKVQKITLSFFFIPLFSLLLIQCGKDRSPAVKSQSRSGEKNLLLITIDTLRTDRLGVYSDEHVKTPRIDAFAEKSVVFTRAFAHNPTTLPSHTNILTGTTPLYHGVHDNIGFRLADGFVTLAEFLKERGFDTAAFLGAFPLDSRFGLNQGFDVYDDSYPTHHALDFFFAERKAAEVLKSAREWLDTPRENPWFAWVHLFDPHHPYGPPAPFDQEYAHDLYSGEVAYVDRELGGFFAHLRETGRMDSTLVILTADHGEALGEKGEDTHSYFAYNNTIHIPLIIHLPGETDSRRVEDFVSHIDLFPTVCELFDQAAPDHLQGRSLVPLLKGKKGGPSPLIYFESLNAHLSWDWAPLRGMIVDRVKFIDLPIKEVYDLTNDLDETRNLAGKQDIRKLVTRLSEYRQAHTRAPDEKTTRPLNAEEQKILESLGYVSQRSVSKKKYYSREDDLKVKLEIFQLFQEAGAVYTKDNPDQSLELYRQVIDRSPSLALAYIRMASIQQNSGRIKEAVSILEEGLQNNPGNPMILSKLGIMLAEDGQAKKAIQILNLCTRGDDFNPEVYNFLGISYAQLGEYQKALENYQKILAVDQNYASVYNNIGSLYLTLYKKDQSESDYLKALQNLQTAVSIDKNLHTAYNSLGVAYNFKKQYQKAIQHWQIAINIKPDYFDPYLNITLTSLNLGDRRTAWIYLQMIRKRLFHLLSEQDRAMVLNLQKQAGR